MQFACYGAFFDRLNLAFLLSSARSIHMPDMFPNRALEHPTVMRSYWRCLHHLQNDGDYSVPNSQLGGSSARKIDDPRFYKWTTVVDANYNAAIPIEAAHPYFGTKGKRGMGGRQLVLIVDLSAGCLATVVRSAIPTRQTAFDWFLRGSHTRRRPQEVKTHDQEHY